MMLATRYLFGALAYLSVVGCIAPAPIIANSSKPSDSVVCNMQGMQPQDPTRFEMVALHQVRPSANDLAKDTR